MRKYIVGFNQRINGLLAPKKKSRMDDYMDILHGIEFSRALHFGSGRDKRNIGQELKKQGDVVSLDPDYGGIKSNANDLKIVGDGQNLPFKKNSFDLVFSEYVFEHLPDPHLALSEIDRILSPGGSFVVLVPNPNHYYAKVADATPFWFHKLWFTLQGVKDHKKDRFPTQYKWGEYTDFLNLPWGELVDFHSYPGPTGYTMILPFHFLFVFFDRIMEHRAQYHVAYIGHFRK